MYKNIRKYIPSIITCIIGIIVFLVIPSQIDLSRVKANNITGIDSRTLPYILSILIIFLSLLELFFIGIKKKGQDTEENIQIDYAKFIRVFVTFIGVVLWIVLVPYLGFILSTILLLGLVMVLMGNKKWLQIVFVPIITSFLLSYIFTVFIGRTLPLGIFFN